jgi:hypothetical protein
MAIDGDLFRRLSLVRDLVCDGAAEPPDLRALARLAELSQEA